MREQGTNRTYILAGVRTAAAGIVADDATGVGVTDDVLLVPVALVGIAAYVLTDSAATQHELSRAWNALLGRISALGVEVQGILAMSAKGRGRVADTGIMAEVHASLAVLGLPPNNDNICKMLAEMYRAARKAKDAARAERIKTTQKARGCRAHRGP